MSRAVPTTQSFSTLRHAGSQRGGAAAHLQPATPRKGVPRRDDRPRTPPARRGVSQTPQPPKRGLNTSVDSALPARSATANDDGRPGTPPAPGSAKRRADLHRGGEAVTVAVRVRGFLAREIERKDELAIRMRERTTEINLSGAARGRMRFTFDHCFWSVPGIDSQDTPFASQEDVYSTLGVPVVDNALRGFNAAIIAYGQTGSGKSYSIFGPPESLHPGQGSSDLEGLIPRVCKELFRRLRTPPKGTSFKVTASMIEIYMEKVYDLLNNRNQLTIRGDLQRGFNVPGRSRKDVRSYSAVEKLLQRGEDQKTTAATALNERSSRAHTLFELELRAITEARTTTSKLTLCDLAGSERCKDARTTAGGKEFNQACTINMSLLCLGKCVEAVAQRGARPDTLVTEFRNSALTKLLRDSLGGNSKTVILTTLSPSERDSHTTLQALRFADRAKQIQTHAVINEDALWEAQVKARLMRQIYQQRLDALNREFELSKQQAELEERGIRLESEQVRLEAEKEEIDTQRTDLLRSKEATDADRRRLEEWEVSLRQRMEGVQREHEELRIRATELEGQNARQSAESQEAKREKEELEEEVCLLQAKVDLLRKQLDDQIVTADAEQKALQAKFAEERTRYVEQMMQSVSKLQRDIQQRQEKADAQRRSLEAARRALDAAEEGNAGLLQQVQSYKKRCEEVECASSDLDVRNGALSAELRTRTEAAERLRAELTDLTCAQEAAREEAAERYAALKKESARRADQDQRRLQEFEAAHTDAQRRLTEGQQRQCLLQQRIGGLTEKVRAAELAHQEAAAEWSGKEEAARENEAALRSELQKVRRAEERRAETAAEAVRAEKSKRHRDVQAARDDVKKLSEQLENSQRAHADDLRGAAAQHDDELRRITMAQQAKLDEERSRHADELSGVQKDFEEEQRALTEEHRQALVAAESRHTSAASRIREEGRKEVGKLEAELWRIQRELKDKAAGYDDASRRAAAVHSEELHRRDSNERVRSLDHTEQVQRMLTLSKHEKSYHRIESAWHAVVVSDHARAAAVEANARMTGVRIDGLHRVQKYARALLRGEEDAAREGLQRSLFELETDSVAAEHENSLRRLAGSCAREIACREVEAHALSEEVRRAGVSRSEQQAWAGHALLAAAALTKLSGLSQELTSSAVEETSARLACVAAEEARRNEVLVAWHAAAAEARQIERDEARRQATAADDRTRWLATKHSEELSRRAAEAVLSDESKSRNAVLAGEHHVWHCLTADCAADADGVEWRGAVRGMEVLRLAESESADRRAVDAAEREACAALTLLDATERAAALQEQAEERRAAERAVLAAELAGVRADAETVAAELHAAREDHVRVLAEHDAATEAAQQSHSDELAAAVAAHQEEMSSALHAHAAATAEVERRHEEEMAAAQRRHSEEMSAAAACHERGVRSAQENSAAAAAEAEERHAAALESVRQSHSEELAAAAADYDSRMAESQDSHTAALAAAQADLEAAQQRHSNEIAAAAADHDSALAEALRNHAAATAEAEQQHATSLEQTQQRCSDELAAAAADHEGRMAEARESHASALAEERRMKAADLEAAQKRHVEQLEAAVANHESKMAETLEMHAAELAEAARRHAEAAAAAQQKHSEELAAAAADHECRIQVSRTESEHRHAEALEAAQRSCREELAAAAADHERKMGESLREHAAAVAEGERRHAAEMADVESARRVEVESLQEALSEERTARDAESARRDEEAAAVQALLEAARAAHDTLQSELQALRDDHDRAVEAGQQRLQDEQAARANETAALRAEHAAELRSESERHAVEQRASEDRMAALQATHDGDRKADAERHAKALEGAQAEHEAALRAEGERHALEARAERSARNDEVSALLAEHAADLKSESDRHAAELRAEQCARQEEVAGLQGTVAAEKERHAASAAAEQAAHAERVSEMQTAHSAELDERAAELRAEQRARSEEVAGLVAQHAAELKSRQAELQSEREQHAAIADRLRVDSEAAAAAAAAELRAEQKARSADFADHQKELQDTCQSHRCAVEELTAQLRAEQEARAAEREAHARSLEELQQREEAARNRERAELTDEIRRAHKRRKADRFRHKEKDRLREQEYLGYMAKLKELESSDDSSVGSVSRRSRSACARRGKENRPPPACSSPRTPHMQPRKHMSVSSPASPSPRAPLVLR